MFILSMIRFTAKINMVRISFFHADREKIDSDLPRCLTDFVILLTLDSAA